MLSRVRDIFAGTYRHMYGSKQSLRPWVRSLATKPAGRALLITLLVYFITFQYCRHRLWRDPHSAFFVSDHVYDFEYSEVRKGQAENFVQAANDTSNTHSWQKSPRGSSRILCAAYATIKRPDFQYLTGSIGSMLHGLDTRERNALYVYLLFADTDPSRHPEWRAPWTLNLVDKVGTYNITEKELAWIRQMETERNFYVKGLFDYIYILEECMTTTALYIAIFEDDIIFADGWMARLVKALAQLKQDNASLNISKGDHKDGWLYLRLFHTETSLMWNKDDILYKYMLLVFTGVITLIGLFLVSLRRKIPLIRPYLDSGTIVVLCFVTVPLFIALLYMMGKWALLNPQGLTKLNQHGCCTQALVFQRAQVPPMIEWLRMKKQGQTDLLMEQYASEKLLDRYALFPQAVQHVGRQSSRDNLAINSRSTWAFYFERNDPETLKEEHEESIKLGLPWAELRSDDG